MGLTWQSVSNNFYLIIYDCFLVILDCQNKNRHYYLTLNNTTQQLYMQAKEQHTSEVEHTRILTVKNKMGIHARPAAMIVRIANQYNNTEIVVEKDEEEVNGKSIMGLMMLAAGYGAKLTFRAYGNDAKVLLDELENLFARKFEEA